MSTRWVRSVTFLALVLTALVVARPSHAAEPAPREKPTTRKKVKYRDHTQIDFSGQAVEGKIRSPELFYIFQRKRSPAYRVTDTPANFAEHRHKTVETLKRRVPK